MSHAFWTTRKTTKLLLQLGVPGLKIEHMKSRQTALCSWTARRHYLSLTKPLSSALFMYGVSPERTEEIAEYLAIVEEEWAQRFGPSPEERAEQVREYDRQRAAERRAANPEEEREKAAKRQQDYRNRQKEKLSLVK